jgi:hypothetical protein
MGIVPTCYHCTTLAVEQASARFSWKCRCQRETFFDVIPINANRTNTSLILPIPLPTERRTKTPPSRGNKTEKCYLFRRGITRGNRLPSCLSQRCYSRGGREVRSSLQSWPNSRVHFSELASGNRSPPEVTLVQIDGVQLTERTHPALSYRTRSGIELPDSSSERRRKFSAISFCP